MILGFFIGGGIIWWQIQNKDKPVKESNIHQNISQNTQSDMTAKKMSLKEKYKKQLIKYKIPSTFIDGLKLDSTTLTLEQLLALYQDNINDTSKSSVDYDNIVISKDELLYTRFVKVDGQYNGKDDSYELDSVLTDQRNSHKKDQSNIKVEFWRSPINYKGYKFDDIKLVVFGLLEFNNLSLVGHDDNLFIRYNKEYYRIEPTDDFKSFLPVKDASLLRELNAL